MLPNELVEQDIESQLSQESDERVVKRRVARQAAFVEEFTCVLASDAWRTRSNEHCGK